ncbi:MAG TPA: efflux RND transporter periplasmic adaptor subunit [Woeseiaceae bacterium]|nr:efflux RND transporter periplasmic adaptor subunit [Woeseiaceae bacterium]
MKSPAPRRPLIFSVIASAALLGACEEAPQTASREHAAPVRVIAEPMRFEPATTRIEAVGTSRALSSVTLYAATSGEVVAVNFAPGQRVRQGDVLVELDSRDERLAVELGEVRLTEAERIYDRYSRSAETGAVTPTQLDAAATQVEAARIELGRARVALDDRFVKAPFTGHVDVTDVDPGDRVTESTAITTLDDRSSLLVNFEVPEVLVGELGVGNEVSLEAWDHAQTRLAGEVVEVGSRIDPATRTFVARASVDNEQDTLRPGMSFRVSVNIEGRAYPVIAETAVQWGADGAYVWLIVDGVAERRSVKIVQRQQGRVLVDAEIDAGALVVVEGIQRMRNNVPVEYETTGFADSTAGAGGAADAPIAAD